MSTPAAADLLPAWSERLAARVAPDEVELAPDVAAAYAAGGVARRDLLAGPRADPGAFGAGLPLVLPLVLDALGQCYEVARAFLADPAVNSTIATGSLLVAVQQQMRGRAVPPRAEEPRPAAAPDGAEAAERAMATLAAVADRLTRHGVDADRAAALAADVVRALAEDPPGATGFLDALHGPRR